MNKSLEILKAIYKPYRYTIKGNTTLLETTSGDFIIKPKTKNLRELYTYLTSRGFSYFPKLIDDSRDGVNVFEYLDDFKIPKEQKIMDLTEIIASLHNKTSYFKEVSEDTYKAIYEDIKSNINYLQSVYDTMYEIGFTEKYMRPSTYEFMRNYYKLDSCLKFLLSELDTWYENISEEKKIRVSVVHNNLSLDHFLNGEKLALISWDNFLLDTPVIDIVKLYKNEWRNIDFSEVLKRYFYKFPLLDYEKRLLFILISMPPKLNDYKNEFMKCQNISDMINYVYKTEELMRPYYANEKEEE